MAAVTIRNLSDEVHHAIRVRAATNNRSTEAEIRDILETVVLPKARLKMGIALRAISKEHGLKDAEYSIFEQTLLKSQAEPMRFE